jgi:hypothetical protein
MEEILIEMLGRNAFNNDMKVDHDMAKLAKAVKYLTAQLTVMLSWSDEEGVEYIKGIIEMGEEILIGN